MTIKIGINGFGRIGRLVFRVALDNPEVEVVAINDLSDPATIAYLLKYDSVHGVLDKKITSGDDYIEVDGQKIVVTTIKDPASLRWGEFGVDIAAECTGLFRDKESASKHLEAGARKVIISAPASDPDITVVMGVNSNQYDPGKHNIISNASCTTNCLAPVAKVLLENFGVKHGLMTTIHSYTGDQRLLDFPHKDLRRARAAALSMIPTVDLVVKIEKSGATVSDINKALKEASESSLSGILGYSDLPLVSTDFNGSSLSSIVDAQTTYVMDDMVKVLSWYDNEAGYSTRMVDLAAMIGAQL
ncbi:MAG: aldehyde dehydrogenase [Deltaproteobacteria bacterium]|nr:aldehyde dehydrogenase [Deltaproteobacteria bacterium]